MGTRLVVSEGDSALGGVYKLVALQDGAGAWQPAIKVSESSSKTPTPGVKQAFRLYDADGLATADVLALADETLPDDTVELWEPFSTRRRTLERASVTVEPLLETVLQAGHQVRPFPTLDEMRARRKADVARLDVGVRRLINPHIYHVSLTPALWQLKHDMIEQARKPK